MQGEQSDEIWACCRNLGAGFGGGGGPLPVVCVCTCVCTHVCLGEVSLLLPSQATHLLPRLSTASFLQDKRAPGRRSCGVESASPYPLLF